IFYLDTAGNNKAGPTKLDVTTAPVVILSDQENRSTWLRRHSVSTGNSLEHSLLLQASERKSSNAYTLISPFYE
ncbi:hypothetical protein AMECASPLE_031452, partial [Ameca splendens]